MLSSALLCIALISVDGAWELVWGDEFNEPSLNTSLWNVNANVSEGNPATSNQIELYTADNVFLKDGHLVLRTIPRNVTHAGIEFNITSGRVDTQYNANASFSAGGRLEVRAQLQNDAASGIHTAHWLLGYGCWPVAAEIDIMECQSPRNVYNGMPGASWQVATSNYHWGTQCNTETHHTSGTSEWPKTAGGSGNFSSVFTTFAVEWSSAGLDYFVNDTKVNSVWQGMPGWAAPFVLPSWDMYLILSQAYMRHRPMGETPNWAWPVEQRVDYVRVYKAVP